MSTEVLSTVKAFLATPAARDILSLEPSYVALLGRVLKRDGVIRPSSERQHQAATTAWLLELAAEHGNGWRDVAIGKVLSKRAGRTDPAVADFLASVRKRARALADAGELTAAVESLVRALMADPRTTMPQAVEIVIRMKGLEAALLGRDEVRRWIEVFV